MVGTMQFLAPVIFAVIPELGIEFVNAKVTEFVNISRKIHTSFAVVKIPENSFFCFFQMCSNNVAFAGIFS